MEEKEIESITVQELNTTVIVLEGRGKYLIDDNVVESDYNKTELSVIDINNIRRINENFIISHYIDKNENTMSLEDHEQERATLLKNAIYNDCNECYDFQDGDEENEIKYMKFCKKWKTFTKCVQSFSDPIKVKKIVVKYETGNKFIDSAFIANGNINGLYVFKRQDARSEIIREVFANLGMSFQGKIDYSQTANKKVWGNSDHSGLRYVVAFNTYIFGDSVNSRDCRGSLEDMMKLYKEDKEYFTNYITLKYKSHFGTSSLSDITINKIIKDIRNSVTGIRNLDLMKRSNSRSPIIRILNEIIETFERSFKENDDNN